MSRNQLVFAARFLVLGAATLALAQCSLVTIRDGGVMAVGPTDSTRTMATPIEPMVLRSPRAVLVLDASGSMKQTDPRKAQVEKG